MTNSCEVYYTINYISRIDSKDIRTENIGYSVIGSVIRYSDGTIYARI